jgi:hypothetical protein
VKHSALFGIVTQTILQTVLLQATASALPPQETPLQRFVCNTGYTVEKCKKEIAVLRANLAKYPTAQLGDWTWILVRSEDWKPILLRRGLDPDSPAFTFYAKHETFIEEALVTQVPGRGRELLLKWNMSMKDLLDLAITHEMGHALCDDKDESNADRVGQLLREGRAPSCGVSAGIKTERGKLQAALMGQEH